MTSTAMVPRERRSWQRAANRARHSLLCAERAWGDLIAEFEVLGQVHGDQLVVLRAREVGEAMRWFRIVLEKRD